MISKMCFEMVCIHNDNLEYTLHLQTSVNVELGKEQRRENNNKRKIHVNKANGQILYLRRV